MLFAFPRQKLFAQNETANWFFGDKLGFHFSGATVTPLSNGQLQYNEGASAISDCRGNLLFYTDGVTVWNRNHSVMVNGSGLLGHYSATQSSVIVPMPGNCNLFYVFTLDGEEHGLTSGMCYSVVDMSLQNGLGEVTQKNSLLYTPSTEKMAAVLHANGRDCWIVTHAFGTNQFYVWLLTDAGVSAAPVISSSGLPIVSLVDAIGEMKLSPDGKRLVYVTLVSKQAEVFDFDDATGVVSNPITLTSNLFDAIGGLYGVEFSTDGKKLYITNSDIDYLNKSGNLYQFSLDAGNPVAVVNSKVLVGNNAPLTDLRGLQLASDGKIYVSRSLGTFAGVIQNPDVAGTACNYIDLGVATSGNTCSWTFPSFVASYFRNNANSIPIAAFEADNGCAEQPEHFIDLSENTSNALYEWTFGDGDSSNLQNPVHVYDLPGTYTVQLIVNKDCCRDTAVASVTIEDCFYSVYVPNAFTPDCDGYNETVSVVGKGIRSIDWSVYNRWGQQIFATNTPAKEWDGTFNGENCPAGIYMYRLQVDFTDGHRKYLSGMLTLIR
ncbi:MAG TPA: gliding motility-associated C-terminal domain-containing protein [Bacteroidia bacterium]|nr:gliding motility-associated C-terminal domain-containing protein [Bacteroidia bacterium]